MPSPSNALFCPSTVSLRLCCAGLCPATPLLLIVLLRLCRSLVLQHPAFAPPKYSALCLRGLSRLNYALTAPVLPMLCPRRACHVDATPSPIVAGLCASLAYLFFAVAYRRYTSPLLRTVPLRFTLAFHRVASLCPRYELPNNALAMRSLPLFALAKHIYTVAGLCHEQP